MIIDFHTHTFPSKIAAAALQKMQGDCHSAAFTLGTDEALIGAMKEATVNLSVVLPVVTNPIKTDSINRASIEKNGKDGLIYFGGIHPDTENVDEQLKNLAKAGIKGIKIHPVYQNADIDDKRFLNILYKAAENDLIVVTHAGDDIGFPGVVCCNPKMLLNAVKQVGKVKLVAAHMGGWKNWEEVGILSEETNVFIDTAFSLGEITPIDDHYSEDELRLLNEEGFVKLVKMFGSNRVLFGTDSPWDSQKKAVEQICALPLSEEDKQNILSKNAAQLLKI